VKGARMKWHRKALSRAALILAMIGPFGLGSARADEAMIEGCVRAAAELHHVQAGVLVLLMSVEAGPMQVNDTWVPKIAGHWRASRDAAYRALRDNFCANVEGGAWILRQALDEAHDDLWKGVALYHSHDPVHKLEYMRLVYAQAMRLKRESARELASADPNGGGR
jgi:hypothetical protein